MELRRMTFGDAEEDFVSIGTIAGASLPTGYMFACAHGGARNSVATIEMSPREMRELAQMLKDCATRVEDEHDTEGWS